MERIRLMFLFLIILGVLNVTFSQEDDPILNEMVHGDVETLTVKSYVSNENWQAVKKGYQFSWEKDKYISYDSSGNILEIEYMGGNKIVGKEIYTYKDGHIVYSHAKYAIIEYKYDEVARISELLICDRQPSRISTGNEKATNCDYRMQRFNYNDENLLGSIVNYDQNGDEISVQVNEYTNHLEIQQSVINHNDGFKEIYDYSYDIVDRLEECSWSDSEDGLIERTTYGYDEAGSKIYEKWELFDEGMPEGGIITTYENGLPVNSSEYENDDSITHEEEYSYENDEFGNWIKRKVKVNNEDYYLIIREINYREIEP